MRGSDFYKEMMQKAGRQPVGTEPYDKPINHLDACAMEHDRVFSDPLTTKQQAREADRMFLKCLYSEPRPYSVYVWARASVANMAARFAISAKITAEDFGVINKGAFSTASGISPEEDKKRQEMQQEIQQEMTGDVTRVNETQTEDKEDPDFLSNMWIAILARFMDIQPVLKALGLNVAAPFTLNMLVRAVKNYKRGPLQRTVASRVVGDFLYNVAEGLRRSLGGDDAMQKAAELMVVLVTGSSLDDFTAISDLLPDNFSPTGRTVAQAGSSFLGVRAITALFDNYFVNLLPQWLTSSIRDDAFYAGERITPEDIQAYKTTGSTNVDEQRFVTSKYPTSMIRTVGMPPNDPALRKLILSTYNIASVARRTRAVRAMTFITDLQEIHRKRNYSTGTIMDILSTVISDAPEIPSAFNKLGDDLRAGRSVTLEDVKSILDQPIARNAVNTILRSGIADQFVLGGSASALRKASYIDIISNIGMFSDFRNLFK